MLVEEISRGNLSWHTQVHTVMLFLKHDACSITPIIFLSLVESDI